MQQDRKHNSALTPRAKELRKNMTKQERRLWHDFLRAYPIRILRQKVVGQYIADFYCAKAKLVIELDGGQHYTEEGIQYDSEREQAMWEFGIETIRYANNDIDNHFDAVCGDIDKHIQNRVSGGVLIEDSFTPPPPSSPPAEMRHGSSW